MAHSPRLKFHVLVASAAILAMSRVHADALADPLEPARNEFLRAYAHPEAEPTDSEALRAYPLYPYLTAARIQYALETATEMNAELEQRAREFLDYHVSDPVSAKVRGPWLKRLAQRQDWPSFLRAYRQYAGVDTGDPVLRCQYLGALIKTLSTEAQSSSPQEEIVREWLSPQQLPAECEPVFQWARDNGVITEELIEQRVRLLLANDQGRFAALIARQLPPDKAFPLKQWADLIEEPERAIDALIAQPATTVEPAALLAGWTKLARKRAPTAFERYDRLLASRKLDATQASPYALQLALGLSWGRRREALDFFSRVQPQDMDDYALTWKARAALWAGEWDQVNAAIGAMSATQREEARWRYWAARSAAHAGNRRVAEQLYSSLLTHDNYYSAMAAAHLHKPAQPHPEPLSINAQQLDELASQAVFMRVRELLLCQFRPQALAEWAYGMGTLDPELRKQAIHLASMWHWHEMAVATATQQRVFNDYSLLYPRPYEREVRAAVALTHLPAPLIYGVIRQESLFRPDAISSAGAHGLMQLNPETAKRTARVWKRPQYSRADLFDPAVNIALGSAHLRDLMKRFDGQTPVALAAYNAGPNAAARWLPDRRMDADIWIENIPYNETRDYVQRIHWHWVVFAWLKQGKPLHTRGWINVVQRADRDRRAESINR